MDRRTWMKVAAGAAGLALAPAAFAQDPPAPPDLKSRRKMQLDRLKAYAASGKFPVNRVVEGRVIPVFYDFKTGIACAVGHLMILDGQKAVVQDMAMKDNHVRILDVKSGPVYEWITGSGLTQEECALIQPSYDFERPPVIKDSAPLVRMHLENVHQFLSSGAQSDFAVALAERRRPRTGQ